MKKINHEKLVQNHKNKIFSLRKQISENGKIAIKEKIEDLDLVINLVYKDLLKRTPSEPCVKSWLPLFEQGESIAGFYKLINNSQEAIEKRKNNEVAGLAVKFIVDAYEYFLNRIPSVTDILNWEKGIKKGVISTDKFIYTLYSEATKTSLSVNSNASESKINIMGTNTFIGLDDWNQLKLKEANYITNQRKKRFNDTFTLKSLTPKRFSLICSLYKGGEFIHSFLENITSQEGFKEYCELVIIDANSPECEYKIIEKYQRIHGNILYIRTKTTIPIYEAWNLAIRNSSGEYITNTNVDDWRSPHSIITQASFLDNLPFADVVYQDFYYSLEFNLDYDQVQEIGLKSDLPHITSLNILSFNSPHNAPMWRKSLHDEVGYFNENFITAGDYDFWCRCILAKKYFYKINEPHVVYYNNPKGLSTSYNSKGVVEANQVTLSYGKSLLGSSFLSSNTEFVSTLNETAGENYEINGDEKYRMAQDVIRKLSKAYR